MKILIIGSKGMLGTDLLNEISKTDMDVIGWDIQDIDITKKEEMAKIEEEKPDVLINCAAYTNVDKAESEKERCYSINVNGVKNLVGVCRKMGAVLMQISTDYVFDGEKEGYDEEDEKDPINYYGQTKSEGEDVIVRGCEKYYIIRTSWLFGRNGVNFVETIINLCKEKDEIQVINDQIGNPTFTVDLSKGIIILIENINKYKYGLYHLTNSGKCSWFEFANEIAKLKGFDCAVKPCTTEEYPRDAKRPRFSVLNNNKTEKLRGWKQALKAYLEIRGIK